MNYTLLLTEQENSLGENINPYTCLKEIKSINLFTYATYPYFTYYSKKVTIKTVSNTTPLSKLPHTLPDNEVCISFANSKLHAFFLNTFKSRGGKFLYLDTNEATKDIERTWKILENKINFITTQKVHLLIPHFTKIVYAYRMKTIYNVDINDITY